jgi:hypothetical protein
MSEPKQNGRDICAEGGVSWSGMLETRQGKEGCADIGCRSPGFRGASHQRKTQQLQNILITHTKNKLKIKAATFLTARV